MTTPVTDIESAALPPLADLEWSLDRHLVFGGIGKTYGVSSFSFGGADQQNQDAQVPGEDGERYGVDTRSGRTISISAYVNLYSGAAGLDAADLFEVAWDAEGIRRVAGSVSILRWRRGTRVRRAYGRARECLVSNDRDWTGNLPITCTFRSSEPWFYDDVEQVEIVGMVPDLVGGLVGDLVGDLVSSGSGVGEMGFTVGGTRATWAPVVVSGPIADPKVTVVGQWTIQLRGTIPAGEFVLIDPRPWARDVRRSDGSNASEMLTPLSAVPSQMRLAPGRHAVTLTGNDMTGTATAAVYWRNCYKGH